jgi:hypothetical protein
MVLPVLALFLVLVALLLPQQGFREKLTPLLLPFPSLLPFTFLQHLKILCLALQRCA